MVKTEAPKSPTKYLNYPGNKKIAPLPTISFDDTKLSFNLDKMRDTCLRSVESFEELPNAQKIDTKDGTFVYIPSKTPGCKILGVAHRDSVEGPSHFGHVNWGIDDSIFTPTLDDRAGCFVLLHVLPQLGIDFDVLLTEGEEKGQSTAAYFTIKKQYNWIFEFDRMGDDAVLYMYEDKNWIEALKDAKFRIGNGSCSDISYLEDLKACAVNIGVGYHDYHSKKAWLSINELKSQVLKFEDFYEKYKDVAFPYDAEEMRSNKSKKYSPPTKIYTGNGKNDYYNNSYGLQGKKTSGGELEDSRNAHIISKVGQTSVLTINGRKFIMEIDLDNIESPPAEDVKFIENVQRNLDKGTTVFQYNDDTGQLTPLNLSGRNEITNVPQTPSQKICEVCDINLIAGALGDGLGSKLCATCLEKTINVQGV